MLVMEETLEVIEQSSPTSSCTEEQSSPTSSCIRTVNFPWSLSQSVAEWKLKPTSQIPGPGFCLLLYNVVFKGSILSE